MKTDRRTFVKTVAAGTAALGLPSWTRGAISTDRTPLVRVHHVPVPDFSWTNAHPGVESLLFRLASAGRRFYRTSLSHPLGGPQGMIGPHDVVCIKVNAQWKYRGSTNTDVVRGVIQRILEHPDGFDGEVCIIENGQGRGSLNCDTTGGCDGGTREVHANAENESHSFLWLVNELFQDPRVTAYELDDIRQTFINADDHVTDGYRTISDVSYPCFTSPKGNRIEFKEGIWTGSGHDSERLKWINIPTMKDHKDLNVTGCCKHIYGLITTWNEPLPHHDPTVAGQIIGQFYSLVRQPVLHLLDHIWVAHASLCGYPPDTTTRRDMLVAGFDPVAIDAWSARHVLYPISGDPAHDPDIPGWFRTYLLDTRDVLNANGGVDGGKPSTIDEADITAYHQDQLRMQVGVFVRGADVHVVWAGARPPYRIEKDADPTFPAPQVLAQAVWDREFVDPGAGGDGANWYYRVTGS